MDLHVVPDDVLVFKFRIHLARLFQARDQELRAGKDDLPLFRDSGTVFGMVSGSGFFWGISDFQLF